MATAERSHPFPFRTRKLSSLAPMVLHPKGCGRVGNCRPPFTTPRRVLGLRGVVSFGPVARCERYLRTVAVHVAVSGGPQRLLTERRTVRCGVVKEHGAVCGVGLALETSCSPSRRPPRVQGAPVPSGWATFQFAVSCSSATRSSPRQACQRVTSPAEAGCAARSPISIPRARTTPMRQGSGAPPQAVRDRVAGERGCARVEEPARAPGFSTPRLWTGRIGRRGRS